MILLFLFFFFFFFSISKGRVPRGWPALEVTIWCNGTQVTVSWAIVQKAITLLSTTPSLNVEVGFNLAKWKMTSQAQTCAWKCPQRAIIRHQNARYITKQHQNSVWCSLQNQCLGQNLFGIFLSLLLKKKKKKLLPFFSTSSPPPSPRASACVCAWVLGSWVSNVRPCTELSKRRMGWDDWWLGGLKLEPPLQMLLLQKKLGLPTALHSRSLAYRYTHHFQLPTSQAIHRAADSVLSRAHAQALPSLLGSFSGPRPNVGILNPSQIKKKKKDKWKDVVFLFCVVLFVFRLHLLWEAMDGRFLEHKSDDKIINGSRAMSYLISCIFMKGATQLGPCAVGRETKGFRAPHARHEGCHCGDGDSGWKSLSDCVLYYEKKEARIWRNINNNKTTKQALDALARFGNSIPM